MPVFEPWRAEREAVGMVWVMAIGIPIMLLVCLGWGVRYFWNKVSDEINERRLSTLQNGSYVLGEYPPDPYVRPDNTFVDPFMITFTGVEVADEGVRIFAVARNITGRTQRLDCTRDSMDVASQWNRPSVVFSSGSERVAGGYSWCAGEEVKVPIQRGGTLDVVAAFVRDKRFTEDFVVRWGVCVEWDRDDMCVRYTTQHEVDLATATRS